MKNAYFDSMLPPMQNGDILGDYEILSTTVNAGGFGRIYRAHRIGDTHRQKFAIKEFCVHNEAVDVTRRTMGMYTEMQAEEVIEVMRAKFFQETKMLLSMGHRCHANVPHIHGLPKEDRGRLYYVMDYIEGPTLKEEVDNWGIMPEEQALKHIAYIGNVLHQAHRRGLVHCDISPNNIIVAGQRPVLVDFGNARSFNMELTLVSVERERNSSFALYQEAVEKAEVGLRNISSELIEQAALAGTPGFQPLSTSLIGTPSGDVYSLAATLFYILTGKRPGRSHDYIEKILQDSGVSKGTIAVVVSALSMPEGLSVSEFLKTLVPGLIDNILEDRF